MTLEDIEVLCRDDVRRAIEDNLGRDAAAVALDKHIPCPSLVATQVKYLQRARKKLPSYYDARCIMVPLSFEQSSGEDCAHHKAAGTGGGEAALDLTCGLGVDAWAFSKHFGRVVAVERNDVVAAAARENFRRLRAGNIEVVCDSAESYVNTSGEHFDWCCADPDRRSHDGRRLFLPQDCSPDIFALGIINSDRFLINIDVAKNTGASENRDTTTEKHSDSEHHSANIKVDKVVIKNSPMYDVDEAFRAFGRFGSCSVEAVSSGGECKEVLVWFDGREPHLTATALGMGSFSLPADERMADTAHSDFTPQEYRYAVIPDVSIVKTRLAREHTSGSCYVTSGNGCGFAVDAPEGVLGRVFGIEWLERYEPRRLRKRLSGTRATVLLRDATLTLPQIMRATGIREGGERLLLFTSVGREIWTAELKEVKECAVAAANL